MPKKEILDFKAASRLEQVRDKRSKQMEDRKHRVGRCPDSGSSRESAWIEFSGTTGVRQGVQASVRMFCMRALPDK
jgi:hypothetical protein